MLFVVKRCFSRIPPFGCRLLCAEAGGTRSGANEIEGSTLYRRLRTLFVNMRNHRQICLLSVDIRPKPAKTVGAALENRRGTGGQWESARGYAGATKSPQVVTVDYTVSPADLKMTARLYPLVREAMREGIYLAQPALQSLQLQRSPWCARPSSAGAGRG